MTKAEFVDKLAEKGKITKKQASEAINLIFTTVAEGLVAGDEISIPGFGKFSVALRKARTGLNPQTKEKLKFLKPKLPSSQRQRLLRIR